MTTPATPAGTVWLADHFVSGDVALDLANTVFRRWPELGADLLTDPATLDRWLRRTGLLPDSTEPGSGETELAAARLLRGWLWDLFDAQRDATSIPAEPFVGVLGVARRGVGSVTIDADGSVVASDVVGALASVALRAVTLVLHPPAQQVRACDRCGWFFIDSSRGRRRRWCSMSTCGNQAKAARFRSTRQPQPR